MIIVEFFTFIHEKHSFGLQRGAQKLMGENLKVVWAEFSTLSLAVLLCVQLHGLCKYGRV